MPERTNEEALAIIRAIADMGLKSNDPVQHRAAMRKIAHEVERQGYSR